VPDWLLFVIGILLTIGTGLFVSTEMALVNLDRADLERRQARGEHGLRWIIGALRRTSTHLSAAQLGITLTTLLAGYTLEPSVGHWLEPPLRASGLSEDAGAAVASVAALVLATIFSMIVGELMPQYLAFSEPLGIARVVIPIQIGFTTVFKPAVLALNGTASGILRLFGIEAREELSSARTAEELVALVRRSASEGGLESDTARLLARTLTFAEHTASDVMTPRPRLRTVDKSDSAEAVIALARRTGHSRFPVEDGSVDELVGVVHLKQAVAVPRERRAQVPVGALATEALRVPETMHLDVLLGQLRTKGYQMAVVVDEYGGTAGVATLEDLVEELVGEVSDEHDRSRVGVVRSRDWFTFPGLLRPDELRDRTGVAVPEDGPFETVGGWIMAGLGRIPAIGDEVVGAGGTFRVERMDGRRVDRVRYTPDPTTGPIELPDPAGGAGER